MRFTKGQAVKKKHDNKHQICMTIAAVVLLLQSTQSLEHTLEFVGRSSSLEQWQAADNILDKDATGPDVSATTPQKTTSFLDERLTPLRHIDTAEFYTSVQDKNSQSGKTNQLIHRWLNDWFKITI